MERRIFLKQSSLAAGTLLLPNLSLKNEVKIKVAIVGLGWFGTEVHLANLLQNKNFEVIGICDVNELCLTRAIEFCKKNNAPIPQTFKDYRVMYELPGLQAVTIASPTHWHALQFIEASKKGFAIFLEKPISFDISEGQVMLNYQKKYGNIVQVGFKSLAADSTTDAKNFIKNGGIGKVYGAKVNLLFDTGGMPAKSPMPSTLDWDMYCGPAPIVDLHKKEEEITATWKASKHMDHGVHFDWTIHYFNNIRHILNLGLPTQITATGGNSRYQMENPDYSQISLNYDGLPVEVITQTYGNENHKEYAIGGYIYGQKGTVFVGEVGWEFIPIQGEKERHGFIEFMPWDPAMSEILTKSFTNLFENWGEAILRKTNENIIANLQDAYYATATMIYASMSMEMGTTIELKDGKPIQSEVEQSSYTTRTYRKPWIHPQKWV
ncbi:MAG TPA: Gfo/Idh/MocA family oxidoreductase [Saprospiraceae bacterium]|nr:Gfo/Idh/MocA family oxidoreductase [Saprospiraceae bacterium]HPN68697.1 Gfo/Idh/MocA family oxidoreductase [Saprospiraceae bacterium]